MRLRVVVCGVAVAGLLSFGAGAALGQAIGLNFVNTGDAGIQNGTSDALGPAESAGAPGYEQLNWNNLGRWGQGAALMDSTGAAAGVTATWDSNNTWNTGVGSGTPNNKLMHGYLDATGQPNVNTPPYQFWWNENKPEVYITGLTAWLAAKGAPSYKVVVYTDGDATEGRVSEYWLQSPDGSDDPPTALGSDLSAHVFVSDLANFSGTFTQVGLSADSVANAGAGNFIVFSGLTADRFILRTEEQLFRSTINGFQIVAVPEPVTLGALALGAMGVLARRRRPVA